MKNMMTAGVAAALMSLALHSAQAEVSEVSIASTIGLAQFPARVAYQLHFIEKRAAALGVPNLKVTFNQVSNGTVVSDLLLSGRANIGVSGNVPMFVLWARTKGRIKGMAAMSEGDMFLNTCDPRIKSVKDYTSNDRIAMTGLKTTTYAMMLQMEAAKVFGWSNRNKFADISVGMSDPDGMAAVLSCRTAVKSQMTILPYSTMELASGKAHVVFSSEQLLGHPYTFNVAMATTDFRQQNPKVYNAVVQGLADAINFIEKNPEKAAEMYLKEEPFAGNRATLVKLIKGETPDHFSFAETPTSTKAFLDFLYKTGTIKTQAKSWKDVWFSNVWSLPGN